jgi:hypothetical protein
MSTTPSKDNGDTHAPVGPDEPNLDFAEGDPTSVEPRPEELEETGARGRDAHPDSPDAGAGGEFSEDSHEDTAVDPHHRRQRDVEGHSPPGDYPEPSDDTSIA